MTTETDFPPAIEELQAIVGEIPEALRITPAEVEQRRQDAKGKRLRPTAEMHFGTPVAGPSDPGTVKLLAEIAAANKAAARAKEADRRETEIIKAKRKVTPMATIGPKEQQLRAVREAKTTRRPSPAPESNAADAATQETTMKTPKKTAKKTAGKKAPKAAKKAATPKAAKPAKEPKAPKAPKVAKEQGERAGSKLALVKALLLRPEGCTGAEVLAATEWPTVSMPQQAKAAGLSLRKEKEKGSPTRYFGTAA